MKSPSLEQLYQTTRQALFLGGAIVKKGFDKKLNVSFKDPISPVTQIDLAAEKKIIGHIRRSYPAHSFLAEESAFLKKETKTKIAKGSYRWLIDPLDGTTNFVHGIPMSSVSIAVEKDGQVLVGGVFDPFRKEMFLAALGKGATLNGKRIRVSSVETMLRSLLITGFPYDSGRFAALYVKSLQEFLGKSMGIRRFGSAAIDLSWVACGRAEGFWEYNLNPWDVAAGSLLVTEAGGRITDFLDRPYQHHQPRQTLATNGLIHDATVDVFKNIDF